MKAQAVATEHCRFALICNAKHVEQRKKAAPEGAAAVLRRCLRAAGCSSGQSLLLKMPSSDSRL
jgi:hypothetical protein